MMKSLFIIVTLFSAVLTCKGQKQQADKVYLQALEAYTYYADTAYHHKSIPNIPPAAKRAIYLQEQNYIDSIPENVNGYPIVIVNDKNRKKLYKDHKGTLIHTVMSPVKVIDSTLEVTITPYSGKLKGNHLYLGVSSGITVLFSYNCKQHRYVVSKVYCWDI